MNFNRYFFPSINSTSTYASENALNLITPALIIADEQTEGRGRRGNKFYSPKNSGLYFTLLFRVDGDIDNVTPAAAVAVCRSIEKLSDKKPVIKWVNDIFINNKKVCGILAEAFVRNSQKFISIGIGINLTTEKFPENLPHAGSAGKIDKEALISEISEYIGNYISSPDSFDIRSEYDKRLFIKGMNIEYSVNGQSFNAEVIGINEEFNLTVKHSDGNIFNLSSGEISIKL